jgi:hypothetical protein
VSETILQGVTLVSLNFGTAKVAKKVETTKYFGHFNITLTLLDVNVNGIKKKQKIMKKFAQFKKMYYLCTHN